MNPPTSGPPTGPLNRRTVTELLQEAQQVENEGAYRGQATSQDVSYSAGTNQLTPNSAHHSQLIASLLLQQGGAGGLMSQQERQDTSSLLRSSVLASSPHRTAGAPSPTISSAADINNSFLMADAQGVGSELTQDPLLNELLRQRELRQLRTTQSERQNDALLVSGALRSALLAEQSQQQQQQQQPAPIIYSTNSAASILNALENQQALAAARLGLLGPAGGSTTNSGSLQTASRTLQSPLPLPQTAVAAASGILSHATPNSSLVQPAGIDGLSLLQSRSSLLSQLSLLTGPSHTYTPALPSALTNNSPALLLSTGQDHSSVHSRIDDLLSRAGINQQDLNLLGRISTTSPASTCPRAPSSSTMLSVEKSDFPPQTKKRKGRIGTFPKTLHEMLMDEETKDADDRSVSFLANGRAFIIRSPHEFSKTLMPKYFRMNHFASFQRQLNLYEFQRVSEGPEKGAYHHPLFHRERPELCPQIKRKKIKGASSEEQQEQSTTTS